MIGRTALRMAAIEALKGHTMVGGNVLDSEIGALDVGADGNLRTDQEKPFISVYVEGAKLEGGADIRALHRSGPTELVIEIGITAAMVETNGETGESSIVGLQIPPTDPAFEFFLDCTGQQVVNALTDPGNAWAEIWRGLSSGVIKIERRRTADATHGVRIAAHQMVITVDLLPDPVYGEPVAATSIWKKFFDKLAGDINPITVKKRAALLALLGDPDVTLNSEAQRRRFGMTLEEVRALFDSAVPAAEATEPNIASVAIED
ncbi:conserved hypothetical protein [Nitrobacter hamburgensis X14]|uniref:Uncharacterized protein n=1 Tax=Nitrobacter hamburgensis (strain DSM 10229 / NCIMB 13809 / X14) TaxID=323097 RepID=Q1QKS1_NITHX|nr:hypothetical protein [Nitrobacter hamburgensis]ABE63176.1 conserved hypothetical protein [Nitrobacter hamburgensis X14]